MKALPVVLIRGGYVPCTLEQATHVTIDMPGPTGRITLPMILRGSRAGTGKWSWNGDTEHPTIRPSIRNEGHNFICHTWVNDGKVQFLDDSTHDRRGQTVDLHDVESLCG